MSDSEELSESAASADPSRRRRGIYLLPNLFTTATLFGGFYAVIAAIAGEFSLAATAICVAGVADTLDGRVARLTNTSSDFGKEYDSLSDMVTFGLAAGVVIYMWALQYLDDWLPYGDKLGWAAAFVYVACAALRLARFNVSSDIAPSGYFVGLPSPSGAAVTVGLVWACDSAGIDGQHMAIPAFVATVGAGLLMVSNVRFYSFKKLNLTRPVPFLYVLGLLGVFVLAALDLPKVGFTVFFVYAVSGPVIALLRWRRRRLATAASETAVEESPNSE